MSLKIPFPEASPIPSEGDQKNNTWITYCELLVAPLTQRMRWFLLLSVFYSFIWDQMYSLCRCLVRCCTFWLSGVYFSLINSLLVWCRTLSRCWRHWGMQRCETKDWASALHSSDMVQKIPDSANPGGVLSPGLPGGCDHAFLDPFPLAHWPFLSQPASDGAGTVPDRSLK